MRSLFRFALFAGALAVLLVGAGLWRGKTGSAEASTPLSTALLEEADRQFTALVASVLPSVVSLDALPAAAVDPRAQLFEMLLGLPPRQAPPQLGSGVIVSEDGHLLTNHHVIERAGAVRVHLSDGRIFPARLVGTDPGTDVAVLKIEAPDLKPARWGDSDAVQLGQKIFAVGNPLGLQETVTQGIISGKGRRDLSEAANEFFQTDAAINPGNSGGPIFNIRGELVGIANMVAAGGEGVAFAIPSNTARRVFESIRRHGRYIRPWFGTYARPLTSALAAQLGLSHTQGALILGTFHGSPAQAAGVQPGDVIIEFNGKPIRDPIDLRNRVAEREPGERVSFRLLRGRQEMVLEAKMAPEPSAAGRTR